MNKPPKKDNTYCCVPQCNSRGSRNPDLSFHLFPNEKIKIPVVSANGSKTLVSRKSEWIRKLRIGKEVSSRMTVCSKHFKPSDYSLSTSSQRPRLKPYTVPSCFLPVLSVEKTVNSIGKNAKAAEREHRYGEINRKKENSAMEPESAEPGNSACFDEKENSDNNQIEDCVPVDMDIESEKSAVEALLGLNDPESLVGTADKATQVVSGDIQLPYLIQSTRLTDKQLNSLTGLPSLALLNKLAEAISMLVKFTNKHILPVNERIILVFMKIKLNISFSCISIFFGCTVKTACNIFSELAPKLSTLLGRMIEFPEKEVILANMPKCFKGFSETRVVLDCTEISVQKVKCIHERLYTYSQYKGDHTVKYLIGTSPGGVITFVSKGYGGRASDKSICENSHVIEMLEPCSDAIMVDKGFLIDDKCQQNCVKLFRLPFLTKKKPKFSPSDSRLTKKIACARVHVERVIQRIKTFRLLQGRIPCSLFHLIDKIVIIAAGITNLSPPVLQDSRF